MTMRRRALLAAPLAAAACRRGAAAAEPAAGAGGSFDAPTAAPLDRAGPPPALRELAAFPVGTEVTTEQLDDPDLPALAARHFSQITPGYQLKMEVVLKPDGRLDFAPADRIAAWAASNRQRLHAHCLVWYLQDPEWFKRLQGDPRAFGLAYDRYITDVVAHFRGRVVGWDCVNEAVAEDGSGLRPSRWAAVLGPEDHIVRAFQTAHAADPGAILFLNDFALERLPAKRLAFLQLAERLLKRGVPLGGLGSQGHLDIDVPDGLSRPAFRDLGSLGLPVHSSELDVSTHPRRFDLRSDPERLRLQARRYREVLDGFMELPPRQRYAFTIWGVRDRDSWLNLPSENDGADRPLPFDDAGRPKPAFWAMADALRA